jgi:hypothetical protein
MEQFFYRLSWFLIVFLGSNVLLESQIRPISFSMPASKVIEFIPNKEKDFATLIPGDLSTYIFDDEDVYYKDYQRSYFAVTKCKGGWDCMRHYEILANGCIPYFLDLEQAKEHTMAFLPKKLILEAMSLEGVSFGKIDHRKFNKEKYFLILEQLMEHTRKYLTTKAMAAYVLREMQYSGKGKILYLSFDTAPDYMRCTLLSGLKELLGDRVVDFPKIEHIYKSYIGDLKSLYGKGFSYTKINDDLPVDRSNILHRINRREFELIIYGSVHRGLPFYNRVKLRYPSSHVAYVCGEDFHSCGYAHYSNLFLREFSALDRK